MKCYTEKVREGERERFNPVNLFIMNNHQMEEKKEIDF